ncbi:hypothetical protein [Micromonospora pisi]|nr:hypothetical protein [Micromonospora pisi]
MPFPDVVMGFVTGDGQDGEQADLRPRLATTVHQHAAIAADSYPAPDP